MFSGAPPGWRETAPPRQGACLLLGLLARSKAACRDFPAAPWLAPTLVQTISAKIRLRRLPRHTRREYKRVEVADENRRACRPCLHYEVHTAHGIAPGPFDLAVSDQIQVLEGGRLRVTRAFVRGEAQARGRLSRRELCEEDQHAAGRCMHFGGAEYRLGAGRDRDEQAGLAIANG